MPSLLTVPRMNYDYDYDTVQPYFLDGEEEDFYPPPRSQLGPGEDVWKKFELLQTPPLSPGRSSSLREVPLSAADHLEAVSDLLDDDCNPSAALLQSFIIQDCMWSSSFAAAAKLEEVVSKRLAALQARRDSSTSNEAGADHIHPSEVFPGATLSEESEESEGGAQVEVTSELCLDTPPLSSSSSSESGETHALIVKV